MTELDNALQNSALEERETFLDLLKSLNEGDTLLVYSSDALSHKVGELVKVFDCILKHDINLHLCKEKVVISGSTTAKFLMNLLSKQREKNINQSATSIGRPKGSFSKSKFDRYKVEIVSMLEQSLSVSEIAKRLGVSRSSLKDYINSRSLKEIVGLQKNAGDSSINIHMTDSDERQECPLTNT
jgi:DNA invertase Pin-like site-specific DNA recombinase